MNNYIIYKITHKLHKLGFFLKSTHYFYQDSKEKHRIIKSIKKSIKIFNDKNGYFEYLEIPITTKCNLRCINCSNLIPCYKEQKDLDVNIIKQSINEFLKCINNIVYIRILGGEPFLCKNLYEITKTLLKSKKIQRIEIVTNGIIIPKEKKLINLLRNNRITISISQYPFVNSNKQIDFFKSNNIKYRLDKMTYWLYYGNTSKRNKTKKQLKKQYCKCHSICKSLINGQIHLCPRSSHGTDLGIIKNNENDYINILDNKLSIKEKKENLHKLLQKKYIKACDYCDFATKKCKKIPVAEQEKKH